jgi:hypothetical protein
MRRLLRKAGLAASLAASTAPRLTDGASATTAFGVRPWRRADAFACARSHPGVAFPLFEERTGRTAMAAKFEISTDKAGKFRFHLKAANYDTKAGGVPPSNSSRHKTMRTIDSEF